MFTQQTEVDTVAVAHLDKAKHLREGHALLWGELEAQLRVLFLTERCSRKVVHDEINHLFTRPAPNDGPFKGGNFTKKGAETNKDYQPVVL